METNVLKHFAVDYKKIIIDEVALEGLEGIGVDHLWRQVQHRLSAEVTEKMKARFWGFVVYCGRISIYQLPEPLPYVKILDRFEIVDEATGHLKEPDDYLDGPYEYWPVEGEQGSSKYYHTRQLIPIAELKGKPYDIVMTEYGDTLALVADKEERWHALAPHMPINYLAQMLTIHYCSLELIGRSRGNGQTTIGLTNLTKVIKDPKTLFYNRKYLRSLDLIRTCNMTEVIAGKGVKALLVRLKRFYTPSVMSMPKSGVLRDVIEYLLKQPDYSEKTEVIVKKGLISQKQNRRLQKTVNIFNFEGRTVIAEDKNKKTKTTLKRKFIYLSSKADEPSESEEEVQEPTLECQYKVGVSLMRQAYERFLDAGLVGLTQVQLAQLLGIEFYTSRGICKIFKLRNIVREYLEDKGKQRTARFIAIAATGEMDVRYAEEKKKFLEYLKQYQIPEEPVAEEIGSTAAPDGITSPASTSATDGTPGPDSKPAADSTTASVSTATLDSTPANDSTPPLSDEPPWKKIKLDTEYNTPGTSSNTDVEMAENESVITEVKVLEGFESGKTLVSFKKNPTLRQLTFANGIFKVLKDKQCVCGYITLSNLASKEINEPPMDTKALKSFIQKLVTDGHIKIYKVKWPGIQKYSVLICAPHVKATDPLIKAKYKEICMRAVTNKARVTIKKDNVESPCPSLSQFSSPRYMKIQKLHEFLMRFAYFEHVPAESHSLPTGFVSIVDFIQEVTIEFVINNMGSMGITEVNQLINESQLQIKLKDAPPHIYKTLMRSNTLQNAIRLNLKVLGMLGLIQLVRQTQSCNTSTLVTYTSFLFYVNRRAKILDTSGVWPKKTAEKPLERSYYFETFEDVTNYWSEVFTISTNTVIDLEKRDRKQLNPPQRTEEEVYQHDNGTRYGDGNGPCGFDSCFFMEIPRLWQTYYMRPAKSHTMTKKKISIKIPKLKSKKIKPETKKLPPKIVPERVSNEKLTRRRNDSSIRWSKAEDMVITMCKAAITILSPSSQPGSLIVRNIVAKDILSINDPKKTKGVCHSRASTLETNLTLIHEKQCIINELRRRRNLIQKYEGLLKKLRLRYSTNMSKFINKSRVPMMELVWTISEVMKSKSYIQKVPCVAVSLADFHEHFTIITSTANKLCNMFKTPEHATLKEAIVLTIMQTIDSEISTEMGKKIYKTFKEYPEASLRIAVEQLRKCGAIAAKEKIFNNQMRKLHLEDICQSSYKISAFYQRKWVNRLNSDFTENLNSIMDTEQTETDVKGSAEINCLYCEMRAYDVMDVVCTTAPIITDPSGAPILPEEINVLVIDTKYKLKTGTLKWKNKSGFTKLSELYQHLDISHSEKYLSSYTSVEVKEIKTNPDLEDPILSHLDKKGEKGAKFQELQELTGLDEKQLIEKLQQLESKKTAKRVGFYENIIVLTKYIQPWSVKIGDKYIVTTPWLSLTGKVRLDIFFKWCGVVMNLVFEKPGSSVAYLADKSEYLTYRSVQDLCMFLEKYECIKLKIVKSVLIDLFSDEDAEPLITEFNPYENPENIVAYPIKNSLTKYCYIRKNILDTHNSQTNNALMDKIFKC